MRRPTSMFARPRRHVTLLRLATLFLMVAALYEAWAADTALVQMLGWLTIMVGLLILAALTSVRMFLDAIDTTQRGGR